MARYSRPPSSAASSTPRRSHQGHGSRGRGCGSQPSSSRSSGRPRQPRGRSRPGSSQNATRSSATLMARQNAPVERSLPTPRFSLALPRSTTPAARPVPSAGSPLQSEGPDVAALTLPSTESDHGDAMQEVIMAIDIKDSSTMGCSYYATETGTLYVSEDMPLARLDVAELLLLHVQPTTVLASRRSSDDLLSLLERHASPVTGEGREDRGLILRFLTAADFSADSARDRLLNVQDEKVQASKAIFSAGEDPLLADVPEAVAEGAIAQESHHIKLMRCDAAVGLDNNISICCAGAVLSDLHRRRSQEFLPDGQKAEVLFQVQHLERFSLKNSVYVDLDTLRSLQILQSEVHPNDHARGGHGGGSGSKESLSIYGLFHQLACTPQGRLQLRQIFLRPTMDLDIIMERQRTIGHLIRPEHAEVLRQITRTLRKIKNMRFSMLQLRRGIESSSAAHSFKRGVWAALKTFCAHGLVLREILSSMAGTGDSEFICKLVRALDQPTLIAVGDMIERTIDFEQSETRQRPAVKAGVDLQLDELKRRYDGMEGFLTQIVDHVRHSLPEWACQYVRSCIFLPQLGFLVVVDLDEETGNGKYSGEGDADTWEKLFTAEATVCYKNSCMKELDEQYGDMYCEIGDREVELVHHLASSILSYEKVLTEASDLCGDFDAVSALALGAEKYGWAAPQLTQSNAIYIRGGRHPLQELVVSAFVPNDCDIAGGDVEAHGQSQLLCVSGPNHSGKSIYLKQTAIIVYLAHIGSFVPAERAIVGVTDKILTRISTTESVSRVVSAFAIDLTQVAKIVRCATRRSLVLIDEFGKGTNMDDGAGLLGAFLDHFLQLGPEMPRVLLATHYHELFEESYFDRQEGLRLAHMEFLTDWKCPQLEDQVTYLFKLVPGHSSSSFGGRCAALNGVPGAIVERADAISLLLSRNEDLASACGKLSEREEKELEDAEAVARRFLLTELGSFDAPGASVKDTLDKLMAGPET